MEINKIILTSSATKDYNKYDVTLELTGTLDNNEMSEWQNYVNQLAVNGVEDLCAKLPKESKKIDSKPNFAPKTNFNRPATNNYPNTPNNAAKPITEKMKNILLQNGYSIEQIANFTFDQAKSIISSIFGN